MAKKILDIQTEFIGHPTPWKRSVLLDSKTKSGTTPVLIEEHLNPEGKVVGRIPMIANHVIVSLKPNRKIEEVLNRVPDAVLTNQIDSMNTYMVEFNADNAKALNEMIQRFFSQTDLVEGAMPNIIHMPI